MNQEVSLQLSLAEHFFRTGNVQFAEQLLTDILKIAPFEPQANELLGYIFANKGDLNRAIDFLHRATQGNPSKAEPFLYLGLAYQKQGRHREAVAALERTLAIAGDFCEGLHLMGLSLVEIGDAQAGLKCLDRALAINPQSFDVQFDRAVALLNARSYEEALAAYDKVLALRPNHPYSYGQWLHIKMQLCDWENIAEAFHRANEGVQAGEPVSMPFPFLGIPSSAALQQKCAEIYSQEKYPPNHALPLPSRKYEHQRIRVGYFSADFYNHATAYLMAELFERHDREKFEWIGFSFGPSVQDAMRTRLEKAFDQFYDVREKSDREIALLARELEIDIAVDLKGFTEDSRPGLFAMRTAPVQVSYLGYPGTMGASCIDYLIADPIVIPPEHYEYYTEKIVALPDSYQVNDSAREISDKKFTREELGLPVEGFVFACFNNNYKITPDVFDIWMRLLQQVKGSVLWLYQGNEQAAENLRKEAAAREIAPERLVFAKKMALPDHLARHRLADLFLDTFHYNAHTGASDALWVGLPVITCLGETFAARVAASLLTAAGLPELIAHSHEAYEALALELATNIKLLSDKKEALARNRDTCPLFSAELFARNIESAYEQMMKRHQAKLPPDHISIS